MQITANCVNDEKIVLSSNINCHWIEEKVLEADLITVSESAQTQLLANVQYPSLNNHHLIIQPSQLTCKTTTKYSLHICAGQIMH